MIICIQNINDEFFYLVKIRLCEFVFCVMCIFKCVSHKIFDRVFRKIYNLNYLQVSLYALFVNFMKKMYSHSYKINFYYISSILTLVFRKNS